VIVQVVVWKATCDSCGAAYDPNDEGTIYFDALVEAEVYIFGGPDDDVESRWTTDGEGKHHCSVCEPLELTQAVKDALARKPGPNDIPLDFGALS
jgi:hypothetical protein